MAGSYQRTPNGYEQPAGDLGGIAEVADIADVADIAEGRKAHDRAKESALRMLAGREHSARELQRKLVGKRHDPELVSGVLAELRSAGLQSDVRFAEGYVRVRTGKGFGPMSIRQGLAERGIADDLVESCLTQCTEHWLDLANRAVDKRFKCGIGGDRNEWNRRARFLSGRGFPADIIYRALGES